MMTGDTAAQEGWSWGAQTGLVWVWAHLSLSLSFTILPVTWPSCHSLMITGSVLTTPISPSPTYLNCIAMPLQHSTSIDSGAVRGNVWVMILPIIQMRTLKSRKMNDFLKVIELTSSHWMGDLIFLEHQTEIGLKLNGESGLQNPFQGTHSHA